MKIVVKWKKFYPLVRFFGAVTIAWLITQFPLSFIEGALYDVRVRLSPPSKISEKIELVALDLKTMNALKQEPKVTDQTDLLKEIISDRPQAVIFMNDPAKWEGQPAEKINFVDYAKSLPQLYFATDQISPVSSYAQLKLPEPYDTLNLGSAPITRDNITFAGDKVTRRLLVSLEDESTLQYKLAQMAKGTIGNIRGRFEADGSEFTLIHFAPAGTFKPWSFIDVRDGRFPKGSFTGKIVLVGTDNVADTEDYILTPYSRDPLAMSRLEGQANIINTLIQNNGYKKIGSLWDLIFTAAVSYLTVLVVWSVRPVKGITLLMAQAAGFAAFSYLLFVIFGYWMNMTHPLIAIFVSYYFFIPYRLIVENKRGWEFEQKNKLLMQVEELKTNFMSMMSHDLKTPIARIQGMAEIALIDSERLAVNQKEALQTIIFSSEQLNGFIGSILDVSRIEDKAVKLHRTSRDINALIDEVVKKFEFLAQSKNIEFETQLEPLFSIKVDVELIRQALANLIENAIKYSKEGTKITICSKEENGRIQVQVKDQGRGIPQDEIDNVFLKFYRSKHVKETSIKGSGLGLYLAKYFVELHGGQINVESEFTKGSQFTIDLPV